MADDKSNRGKPDRDRIDVNDPDELRNWSKSLNKTEEEIKDAVRVVGNSAEKVRERLGAR
jgi:methyl-accepting chemotaxis protein